MSEEGLPTEEDKQRFYAALGEAIAEWANLEDILFRVSHGILGCSKERAAIVFYRTPTLDSRLALTHDLIVSHLPRHQAGEQPDFRLKLWNEIRSRIRAQLPTRNHLAHHPVELIMEIVPGDGAQSAILIKHGTRTSPSELSRKRQDEPDLHTINDVASHRRSVLRLLNDLRNFWGTYLPEQPEELASQ